MLNKEELTLKGEKQMLKEVEPTHQGEEAIVQLQEDALANPEEEP